MAARVQREICVIDYFEALFISVQNKLHTASRIVVAPGQSPVSRSCISECKPSQFVHT